MKYACELDELKEKEPMVVDLDGKEIGLILWKGAVHAYENFCPHMGGPVCLGGVYARVKGQLDDDRRMVKEYVDENELRLVCPWHGFEFDLATGEHLPGSRFHLRKYEAEIRNGQVYVRC
jgi:nitrite reductase/ring-hydroxylating ferredoxin subunit